MQYQQVCPVSLASEVIAERWTPLILREIVLFENHHFSEIQRAVGRISQSLLSQRLRTLEDAGVIERRPNRRGRGYEYHPTQAGRELDTVLNALGVWAQHWIELRQEDCDPAYLMLTVHAVLRQDRLPARRITVRFEFVEHPKIYWLVLDREASELCYNDPGRTVDMVVTVDEQAFGKVLLGRLTLAEAVASGEVRLDGPPELVKGFPTWLGPTRYAPYAAGRWSSPREAPRTARTLGHASAPAPIATDPSDMTGEMRPNTLPSGSRR